MRCKIGKQPPEYIYNSNIYRLLKIKKYDIKFIKKKSSSYSEKNVLIVIFRYINIKTSTKCKNNSKLKQ